MSTNRSTEGKLSQLCIIKTICLISVGWMMYNSSFAQLTVSNGTAIASDTDVSLAIIGDVRLTASSPTTDFSKWFLALTGGAQRLIASGPVALGGLEANGTSSGNKTVVGDWSISNLKLEKGNLVISAAANENGRLIYEGTSLLNKTGTINSYIIGPLIIRATGSGEVFFPIGNFDGFFPIGLTDVKESGSFLKMEAVKGDPSITQTSPEIKEFFVNRYWEFKVESGNFSGSPVRASNADTEAFKANGETGDLLLAEISTNGALINLGTSTNDENYVFSNSTTSASPEKLVIGKSNTITVDIKRFITPNSLDDKNNVLFIQNINYFPENTVTLIDRWGVPLKEWKNFKNYESNDPIQSDFDFTKLGNGNYVCLLEYKDGAGNTKRVLQMISVIK